MFAQLYFLLYCPSVFGTAGLSGNSHPRPQALRPTRPVHTELRRTVSTRAVRQFRLFLGWRVVLQFFLNRRDIDAR